MTRRNPNQEYENFGPYEVYERLGVGGMATVHRAKERGIEGFERIVALKRLLPHLAEDVSFVRSFVREAKLASRLQHANIVQIYELGRVGPHYFISMEYIEGRDVRRMLRQARKITGPPPLSVFLSVMLQLCDALDYAHRRRDQSGQPLNLVHRDVSPSNLLVTESGHLKVIDFGIARAQSQHHRTQTGRVKGKLAYMAPETLKEQPADARADIFSVGVVAHEMLTARPLFARRNEYQTLMCLQQLNVPAPSRHNRKCPPELDAMVLKALDRDRDKRWQSAAELRDALDRLRSQYQVSATNREVASWLEWAFALEAPQTGSFSAISSASPPRTRSGTYPPAAAPARAYARASSSMPAIDPPADAPACQPDDASTGEITRQSIIARRRPGSQAGTDPGSGAEPLPPPPGGPLALDQAANSDASDGESEAEPVAEEAIEFAWGDDRPQQDADTVVLLDEVPDVSQKAVSASRTAPATSSEDSAIPLGLEMISGSGPIIQIETHGSAEVAADVTGKSALMGIGAGMAGERRKRGKRMAIVGGACAAIALVAVLVVLLQQRERAPAAAALPVAQTAALQFIVTPADATIEVLGHGSHTGSPHNLEVAAPGNYLVEIARQGYKSFVTEIAVQRGEKNVIRVALEAGGSKKSQIRIQSTPDALLIELDGEQLQKKTPAKIDVKPGNHLLVLRDDDGCELWRKQFEAKVNTNYEFEPQLERKRKRKHKHKHKHSSKDRDEDPETAQVQTAQTAFNTEEEPSEDDDRTAAKNFNPAPGSFLPKMVETEPPPAPRARPKRTGPVAIPSSRVEKVSGDMPQLTFEYRDVPDQVNARLCIDTAGKVTSVKHIRGLAVSNQARVKRALRKWRYTPYQGDGAAVSACFAVAVNIDRRHVVFCPKGGSCK